MDDKTLAAVVAINSGDGGWMSPAVAAAYAEDIGMVKRDDDVEDGESAGLSRSARTRGSVRGRMVA